MNAGEQEEHDTHISEVGGMSALLSELTKASHHAACLLRPVLKADSRWLCLHRGFCPAAKEHVTDACMQMPKADLQISFLS